MLPKINKKKEEPRQMRGNENTSRKGRRTRKERTTEGRKAARNEGGDGRWIEKEEWQK